MAKTMESPNYPVERPGVPAMQIYGEAVATQQDHERWHREHPGEMCSPEMFPLDNYENIERGERLMGAMTFEAGDAFVPRRK